MMHWGFTVPHAAEHQVKCVFFKGQELLICLNRVSRNLTFFLLPLNKMRIKSKMKMQATEGMSITK